MTTDSLFELLLESAPDAMIVVDTNGEIVLVNRQAETLFGYSRDQMLGKPIEFLVPGDTSQQHVAFRKTYVKSPKLRGMGVGRELLGLRRDGSEIAVEISLSPLDTPSGQFICSAVRDVTARKKMEQEIATARQEADRANRSNSAFLAAASHDLRQPVQALSLLSGAMRRSTKEPKILEMIEVQNQSLTAMTNLLNSLLDISRLNAGAVAAKFENFPINQLIDRLAGEFARQASQKGLSFDANCCGATVRSDPNLLGEIIQNFISNSVRYTEVGKVSVECDVGDGECRIRVLDTGIGIDEDQLQDIFTEFHQCNTAGTSQEGFGLGLAIVSRLSDLLGHHVDVESTPGKGSCFSITVPIVAAVEGDVSPKVESSSVKRPLRTGTILLIEDDAQVSHALRLLFESAGYVVGLAASRNGAIECLKQLGTTPDLLVSDFHLAGLATGLSAVESIRHIVGRCVPAFLITGDTSDLPGQAHELENSRMMRKPIDSDHLLLIAASAIQSGKAKA